MIKKNKKKIEFFLFKSDFLKFKLDFFFLIRFIVLFELIIFSSKKIIKFYYKIINVLFFLLSLLNFNLL